MAGNWAQKCTFIHGQPSFPASPFKATGQNVYAKIPGSDPSLVIVTRVVRSWYNEKKDYYLFCLATCGYYTQVKTASNCNLTLNNFVWTFLQQNSKFLNKDVVRCTLEFLII